MMELSDEGRKRLLAAARASIATAFSGAPLPADAGEEAESTRAGAFVTLRKEGELRGCIGRMEARDSLSRTIAAMARAAAFDDPRFAALSERELPDVTIEITVLSPRRKIESFEEIEIGRHGVYMQKGLRSAVFLPQVATEQGWNREELLAALCRKAGLPLDAWKSPDATLMVFEGVAFEET